MKKEKERLKKEKERRKREKERRKRGHTLWVRVVEYFSRVREASLRQPTPCVEMEEEGGGRGGEEEEEEEEEGENYCMECKTKTYL